MIIVGKEKDTDIISHQGDPKKCALWMDLMKRINLQIRHFMHQNLWCKRTNVLIYNNSVQLFSFFFAVSEHATASAQNTSDTRLAQFREDGRLNNNTER